ncbi:Protein LIAT1 [Acropora cervicornis]|uniref:Protein LIAT1 n=1 Tax=Acropora cervicornis TaxID=6130 RepID=A0AAD9R7D6_ACRCE|nr:Protein LIAT1 [Acropora cervicornis]
MSTYAKKSLALRSAEKPSKLKKKKKRELGRSTNNSETNAASPADRSSEGTSRIKSRTKSHGTETDNRGKNLDDFIPKSRSSSSQNTSSRSRALSSSDGRSTTCSGENFDPVISTKSESSDESRTGETLDSLSQTSSTAAAINETLRWDFVRSNDPDEEEERLRIYKLHRRKRYLEFLQRTNGREAESSFYA